MRHRAVDATAGAHYIGGAMRQRVPRQPSTKWWFLLAAVLATAITWWQHADRPPRRARPAAAAPDDAGDDLVWIEIERADDEGAR